MSLSKLWLFLLTMALGLLVFALLLSPAQVRRSASHSVRGRMELAQQSATLLLQNSARMWIDTAAQLAQDAVLQSALEEMVRGQAELELLHRTAQEQLRKANQTLKLSLLLITDARGRVLARVGQDEELYKDSIVGYPLVRDAVRGYRLDDLWYQGGALLRMAAAPVFSAARDRYVGAVVLGQAVGPELADQLREKIGLDVAFLYDGRVVASSRPAEKLPAPLVQFARDNQGLLQDTTEMLPLQDEVALLFGLPGAAADQGAALALLGSAPQGVRLKSLVSDFTAVIGDGELPLQQLPFVVGGVALLFLIGLVLLRTEAEGPLMRLAAEVRGITRRRADRVEEQRYRRMWRELAQAINAVLRSSRPAAAEIAEPVAQPAEGVQAVQEVAPAQVVQGGALAQAVPVVPSPPAPLPEGEGGRIPYTGSFSHMDETLPDVGRGSHASPHSSSATLPAPLPELLEPERPRGIPLPLTYTGRRAEPPEPEPEAASAKTIADPVLEAELSQLSPLQAEMPTVQDIPHSLVQAAIEQALHAAPAPFIGPARVRERLNSQPTQEIRVPREASQSQPLSTPLEDELEVSFRQIYQEFVVTKQRCHEPVEGLTYDKFAAKLRQSRDQIMRQHSCKSVRFHVYIKEGKAALKATPVTR
jgi:hypothetical protein